MTRPKTCKRANDVRTPTAPWLGWEGVEVVV